jgi:hypothetical protein
VATQQDDEEKQLKFTTIVPPPCGLYKRVVDKRKTCWWKYQILAFVYNACLVLQLLLGATLTALGASDKKKSVAITIIAALNTCVTPISLLPVSGGRVDAIASIIQFSIFVPLRRAWNHS